MVFGAGKNKWEVLWEDMNREASEARQFNRELLIRLEKTYAILGTTLGRMGDEMTAMRDEMTAMRGEIHELKGSVDAQTDAIMRLLDHFKGPNGGPPV